MTTALQPTFQAQVHGLIRDRHLLGHPFYVEWSKGLLSRDQLRRYAGQYLHHVLAEPTYLSAVHSNTPHFSGDGTSDLSARQSILENLLDEELGPDNHPELWMRFCAALGLTKRDLAGTRAMPATERLVRTFTDLCRNRPYYAGLAALHAFESQVPAIARVKIDGLRRFYGFTNPSDFEFFAVHEDADVAHSAAEWRIIERAAVTSAQRGEVCDATTTACESLWAFLDGVYET